MASLVTLADLKTHLRIEAEDTSEDALVGALATAALRACERRIDRSVDDEALTDDDRACIRQAALLIAGGWYSNREASVVDVSGVPIELPMAVTWLLAPLRLWPSE